MKKTKILMPVVAVATLTSTIVPSMALTSCGCSSGFNEPELSTKTPKVKEVSSNSTRTYFLIEQKNIKEPEATKVKLINLIVNGAEVTPVSGIIKSTVDSAGNIRVIFNMSLVQQQYQTESIKFDLLLTNKKANTSYTLTGFEVKVVDTITTVTYDTDVGITLDEEHSPTSLQPGEDLEVIFNLNNDYVLNKSKCDVKVGGRSVITKTGVVFDLDNGKIVIPASVIGSDVTKVVVTLLTKAPTQATVVVDTQSFTDFGVRATTMSSTVINKDGSRMIILEYLNTNWDNVRGTVHLTNSKGVEVIEPKSVEFEGEQGGSVYIDLDATAWSKIADDDTLTITFKEPAKAATVTYDDAASFLQEAGITLNLSKCTKNIEKNKTDTITIVGTATAEVKGTICIANDTRYVDTPKLSAGQVFKTTETTIQITLDQSAWSRIEDGDTVKIYFEKYDDYEIDDDGLISMTDKQKAVTTSVTVPLKVGSIEVSGVKSFGGSQASEIKFTDDSEIYTFEDNAFAFCPNLTDFTIPIDVKNIGYGCFEGCTNLNKINFLGSFNWVQKGTTISVDYSDPVQNATNFKDSAPGTPEEHTGKNWGYSGLSKATVYTLNFNQTSWTEASGKFSFTCASSIKVTSAEPSFDITITSNSDEGETGHIDLKWDGEVISEDNSFTLPAKGSTKTITIDIYSWSLERQMDDCSFDLYIEE